MPYLPRLCFWPVLFLAHLIATALLAWHLLAQIHFAYPIGYRILNLQDHIAEYAPLNRYKQGFEFTRPEDHWRLFGEISDAVQNSGEGLTEIRYTLSNGQSTELMHKAEIIHLQDVANLIDKFYITGILCGLLWVCLLGAACWYKLNPPTLKRVFLGFASGLLLTGAIVLLIGAKNIFYWLHVQIFPENHQWFFYYQDSLMTTLMKAPDIFAFIALLLISLLMFFWGMSYWMMSELLTITKQVQTEQKKKSKK